MLLLILIIFEKLYIYNFIAIVKDNIEKLLYLLQKFMHFFIPFDLPLSTFYLKTGALIVLLQNLYQGLENIIRLKLL